MQFTQHEVTKDLIVVGGGIPGMCAAVQAARHGLSVALINNRGYPGGNASVECFVSICGATGTQEFNLFARESGLVEELLLENLRRNPQGNRFIWDTVLMDFVLAERNLELFLNTTVDRVDMLNESRIACVSGVQSTTEKRWIFHGAFFLDDSGDGTVGALAGAPFRKGREAKAEFGERLAPDAADHYVLPSTLNFTARDTGKPVRYIPPAFALDLRKTDILKYRKIPKKSFYFSQWFYEIGGELDQIAENETIIQKHRELVYGIWDYVKNSGEYDAENYDLDYVSCIPGKRESRRLIGDHILTEQDVLEQRDFEDALGYGGWSIDLHAVHGIFSKEIANRHVFLKGVYQIPYRAGYSARIENLFMAGRCMSTSHVAFGSARVMATLSTLAQGLGTAAFLCKKHNTTPRGVYAHHLRELQCLAMRNDQWIVGKTYEDAADLAADASFTVSSVMPCELTEPGEAHAMEHPVGFILPVRARLGSVYLLARAKADAELTYSAWLPRKRENYAPDRLLMEGRATISAGAAFHWIELPVNAAIVERYVFLELRPQPDIEIARAKSGLPGLAAMEKKPNTEASLVDPDTLETKPYVWRRLPTPPCFRLSEREDIYGAHNLNNGHARPTGMPNIWVAERRVAGETIRLRFPQERKVARVDITFDNDPDAWIWNTRAQPRDAQPGIIKSFTLSARRSDGMTPIADITDNYHRVRRVRFAPVTTDELLIEIHETHGAPQAAVHAVHVFDEGAE